MLEKVENLKDLKKLNINELEELVNDIREVLITKILKNGGHLGPNLGVVELTIALHYVFNSPIDKFVFDVSHQTYTHKILTSRKKYFIDEKEYKNISGFTTPKESEHDLFKIGHTSTSISLALGLIKARDLRNENYNVISVIGDGSLSGGEAFEGLDNASIVRSNHIIIVNDNEMSISTNVGGIYNNLKELRETNGKSPNNFFKTLGFDYIYLEEGNDLKSLISLFKNVKDIDHPIVLHIHTLKGKGYEKAIENKEFYHSYYLPTNIKETSPSIVREYLLNRFNIKHDFVLINAATPVVCGITPEMRDTLKEYYVDVGICEEHALSYMAGMIRNNFHPVFLVFSTFLQRGYDQLLQDLALNDLKGTIVIFSGHISGGDATHVGKFDIGMTSNIPNVIELSPINKEELIKMLDYSFDAKHLVIIRAPITIGLEEFKSDFINKNYDKYQVINKGNRIALLGLGEMFYLAKEVSDLLINEGYNPTLINPRIYSKLDVETLNHLKNNHDLIVTFEDGVLDGGFGEKVSRFYQTSNLKVLSYGSKKEFNDLEKIEKIKFDNHLNASQVLNDIKEILL